MEKLDIHQMHGILLDLAKQFDAVCRKNNIPYCMVGGTLLGAIRHKGFIPWDDDMDFGVPTEYYEEMLQAMRRDLPEGYECSTYDQCEGVHTVFAKLQNKHTRIKDICLSIPFDKQIGVNIDIFPLSLCDKGDPAIKKLTKYSRWHRIIFVNSTSGEWYKKIIKSIIRFLCPLSYKWFLDKRKEALLEVKPGPFRGNLLGRTQSMIPAECYGDMTDYDFEDTRLMGPVDADAYLTHVYKNYMELPPKNKREIHCSEAYKL